MSELEYKVCVVIPVYNESRRINLSEYEKFIISNPSVEVLFVNDASSDNTLNILTVLKNKFSAQIGILSNPANIGKAETIRKGMCYAFAKTKFSHFAFIDADLSVPLNDVVRFLKTLHTSNAGAVWGIRDLADSAHVKRTFFRKYMSYIFRYYTHAIFHFNIMDTQCGAKIFTREIAEILYQKSFETRWLSDVELFIRLKNYCATNNLNFSEQLIPVPVTYYEDKSGSNFNFYEFLRTTYDLIKLSIQHKFFRH